MNDILKAILENAARSQQAQQPRRQQAQPQAAANPMEALIKGILGGGDQPQQQRRQQAPPQQQAGGLGIDDLIGAVLGGSQRAGTQQSGGISDLINAVLGGGARSAGSSSGGLGGAAINPIANILAQRLGIPPAIARAVVAFFMAKFVGGMFNKNKQQQQQRQPEYTPRQDDYGYRREPETLDLDDILDDMDDDYALQGHFANNGMAQELAQMTGIDIKMANTALAEMAKIVGQERRTVKPVRPTANNELKDLLDTW